MGPLAARLAQRATRRRPGDPADRRAAAPAAPPPPAGLGEQRVRGEHVEHGVRPGQPADSTADFVAALRLRLDRRERVPRFVLRLAAAEMVFGLAFYAIWSPEWLGRAARIYGAIALVLAAWWRWYRGRLGRERAQLDALCREPEAPDASPPGEGGADPGTVR